MNLIDDILKQADDYQTRCFHLVKDARIRKLPNGKYRVLSEKGKNLGESDSKSGAEKRLQQVEYFKHKDENNTEDTSIDLTNIDDFSYSAIMRELRQKASKEQVLVFLKLYKNQFDKAVKNKLQKPEKVALQNSIIKFHKINKLKMQKKFLKNAAVAELGDPVLVGKYLADIIRFTLNRISAERRPGSIESLKQKIYNLNENEISNKNMPASSAMGQSITFVKHVLFNHDPHYIREVINNLVRNL
jgi:hypothetical protein